MRALSACLLIVTLGSGCGALSPAEPDWVVNRLPLPSCGHDDEADGPDLAARQCLLEAYLEGTGAELITASTAPTGRGLVQYLRVHENGTVEMFIQHVGTRFWDRLRCERLVATPDVEGPGAPIEPPSPVFVVEDCSSLPVP